MSEKAFIERLDDTESKFSTKASAILSNLRQQQVNGELLLVNATKARDLISDWNERLCVKMVEASNSLTTWKHNIQLPTDEWKILNSDSRKELVKVTNNATAIEKLHTASASNVATA